MYFVSEDNIQPIPMLKAIILVFLFLSLFTRLVSMVFVLNFTTGGVNFTLGISLLPHSVIAIGLLWKGEAFGDKSIRILWGSLFGTSILSLVPNALSAAILSAIALNLHGLVFIHEVNLNQLESRLGLVGGIGFTYLVDSILGQINVYGTLIGMIMYTLILLGGGIVVRIGKNEVNPSLDSFVPSYGYLMLNLLILGDPGILGTWIIDSFWAKLMNPDIYLFVVLAGCTIGLLLSVLLMDKTALIQFPLMELGFLIAYADIIFTKMLVVFTIPIATFLSASLILNIHPEKERQGLKELGFVQGLFFIFMFLYVAAGNWAFMPAFIGTISRGMAGVYLFLAGILFLAVIGFRRRMQ